MDGVVTSPAGGSLPAQPRGILLPPLWICPFGSLPNGQQAFFSKRFFHVFETDRNRLRESCQEDRLTICARCRPPHSHPMGPHSRPDLPPSPPPLWSLHSTPVSRQNEGSCTRSPPIGLCACGQSETLASSRWRPMERGALRQISHKSPRPSHTAPSCKASEPIRSHAPHTYAGERQLAAHLSTRRAGR